VTKLDPVAQLAEKAKTFERGITSLTLAGTFDGVTVTSLTRQGTNTLDTAYAAPQAMSASYITVNAGNLAIGKALLDQVYGTCTYTVTFSNETAETFALTSNALFYTDFDETDIWDKRAGVTTSICEDTVWSYASGVEGFTGSALKYSPADATIRPGGWLIRVFTFGKNGSYGWVPLPCGDDEYITVSFDYMIEKESEPSHGYYYTTAAASGEVVIADQTAGIHHFEVTLKGSDFALFALGCWAGEAAGSVMYIDNFCIVKAGAPAA
jgi:hypothetical protein